MHTFVNHEQSSEERRAKYAFALKHGASPSLAHRLRDTLWTTIAERLGLPKDKVNRRAYKNGHIKIHR